MKSRRPRSFSGWLIGAALFWAGTFLNLSAQPVQTNYSPFGQSNPNDRFTFGARAAALGSAYVGISDDASALFFNPSGLAYLRRGEMGLHGDLGWEGTFQQTAVFGLPTGGSTGIGFAATYFDAGTLEGRDETGSLGPGYGANRFLFQGGGGLEILKDFSLGASLRYSQQIIAGNGLSSFSPDFGILLKPFGGIHIGLDYIYAGWGTWSGTAVSTFRGGVSWAGNLDSSTRLLLAAEDSLEINSLNYIQAGMEVSYQSRFFLRAGYQDSLEGNAYGGFSFGGGVELAGFILDYAYLPNGDLGDTHRLSLIYPFQTSTQGQAREVSPPGKSPQNGSNLNPESVPRGSTKSNINSMDPIQGNRLEKSSKNPTEISGKEKDATHQVSVTTGSTGGREGEAAPNNQNSNSPKNSLTVRFNLAPDFTAQGEAMEAQGNYPESVRFYQEAIKQDPQNSLAWRDMGNVYYKLGKKAYALQCYEKVSKLRPSDKVFGDWLEKFKALNP